MNKQEKFDHWLKIANDDHKAADTLYKGGRWLHTAFYCQQAIEKIVKGLYILCNDDNFPYSLEIIKILKLFEDKLSVSLS
jgi:HEPN domain-containing protein